MQYMSTEKINENNTLADDKINPSSESIEYHRNIILLIGNPNVGKTSIFNQLSRKYAITANYPFTTVEFNTDAIRLDGKEFELIDSAGIYRLDHPSEEGQNTRDIIFNHHPEIIIQVIEAANLERSLIMTAQLLELEIPLIVVLNMVDEMTKQGIRINSRVLSEKLGVPVVETIAIEGKGIENIKKSIRKLKPPQTKVQFPARVDLFYQKILDLFPSRNKPPRSIISLLALEDSFAFRWIEENYGKGISRRVNDQLNKFLDKNEINLSIAVLNSQKSWINNTVQPVVTQKEEFTKFGIQKFGEWSRHPIYGWFIVIGVIFLTYLIVGKFGATFLVYQLEHHVFMPLVELIDKIIPWTFANRFLIGDYGLLTTGLFNAIGTVLPIITLFFLVLNFLEDIGYLTNLIILTSRVFKKIGLSGKSILPIVLGFGCKTMATLSTRILDSKKEKYIAIFLIGLAIPCSSQMSVNIAALAQQPVTAFITVIFVLLTIELMAGLILNKIIPEKKHPDFLIEIPPIRVPDMKLLLQKTYYRTVWFLKEAVPLFLLGAFILFVLHETSGMKVIEWIFRPLVVTLLDLPINFTEALIMSMARSEAGAVIIMNMVKEGALNTTQVIVAIIVITLFIPCISNIMAMIKELKLRKALFMVFVITVTAFLIGGLVNFILRF